MDSEPFDKRSHLVLSSSKRKWLLVTLVSALFTAVGILMLRDGATMGWLVAGFFGLGALVGLVATISDNTLTLTPEGYTVRGLRREYSVRWTDVAEFGVYKISGNGFVGFNYAPDVEKQATMRGLNRSVVGYEAGLSDTYGMSAEELAELMNTWRRRALESAGGTPLAPQPYTALHS